jgi:hypothetical protein
MHIICGFIFWMESLFHEEIHAPSFLVWWCA